MAQKLHHIGFTGTQQGLTGAQYWALCSLMHCGLGLALQVGKTRPLASERVLHHGDCVGGDVAAHICAVMLGWQIVIRPPTDNKKRAYCDKLRIFSSWEGGAFGVMVKRERPYIERNHLIVDRTQFLIAAPKDLKMEIRSGTWATVRYAFRQRKRVVIVWPTGHTQWYSSQNDLP